MVALRIQSWKHLMPEGDHCQTIVTENLLDEWNIVWQRSNATILESQAIR